MSYPQNIVVAKLVQANGSVVVERNGQFVSLKKGDSLCRDDMVKTQDSSVEILFQDGTTTSLGSHTNIHITSNDKNTDSASSLVVKITDGIMRTFVSDRGEHSAETFKVMTPKAFVDMHGAELITKVNSDTSEGYVLLSLDGEKSLLLTTHSGKAVPLTMPGQGALIKASGDNTLLAVAVTQEEIHALVEQVAFIVRNEELADKEEDPFDDETSADEASDAGDLDQNYVALEQSLVEALGDENTQALVEALQEAGFVPLVETDAESPLTFGNTLDTSGLIADAGKDPYIPAEGQPAEPDTPENVVLDGISDFSGDIVDITGGTHVLDGQKITVENDINTGVVISGDAYEISGGLVRAGSDTISGEHMSDGTIVGDVHTIVGGELVAGNDIITFLSKSGGQSIYGDVYNVDNVSAVTFGDDIITIKGDFANSTVAGDASTVAASVTVKAWGSDTLLIEGNMTALTKDTILHGDAVTDNFGATLGGADSIGVAGTVSGMGAYKSIIYGGGGADKIVVGVLASGGEIYGGTGNDTITVMSMTGGLVSGGEGADTITIGASSGDSVVDLGESVAASDSLYLTGSGNIVIRNFDTATDTLFIDGKECIIAYGAQYGNYNIVFESITGNLAPRFDDADASITAGVHSAGTYTATAFDSIDDTLTYSLKAGESASYGTVHFVQGNFTYTTDAHLEAVKKLGAGESLTDSFTIVVTDEAGASAEKIVTVTVEGVNDAPEFLLVGDIAHESYKEGALPENIQGSAAATDIDGDTLTYSVTHGTEANTNVQSVQGTYGSLSINAQTGNYTYTPTSIEFVKGTHTDTFTVYVKDAAGVEISKQVTVTIEGVNDAPVFDSESATHNYTENTLHLVVNNNAAASDADGDSLVYSIAALGDSNTGLTSITGKYGNLDIDAITGEYTFTPTLSVLPQGSFTEIFHVFVTDVHGAQIQKNIFFNFDGDNDTPEFSDAGDISYNYTEDTLPVTVSGSVAATDPNGDTIKYSVAKDTEANTDAQSVQGAYGTLTIDAGTGAYTYTPINSELPKGTHTDTFTVYVKDTHGAESSKTVTVSIEGLNDTPEFSDARDIFHNYTEDTLPATVSDSAPATDVDGDALTYSVVTGTDANTDAQSAQGTYGSLNIDTQTGKYTYTPTSTELAKGTYTDTFTVYVKDTHGAESSKTLTVSIEGLNDTPEFSDAGDISYNYTEDTLPATVSDSAAATDVDGDALTYSVVTGTDANTDAQSAQGIYGTLTIDAGTGAYTYTPTSTELAKGSYTDTFTVYVKDAHGAEISKTVTVSIEGLNDAPVFTSEAASHDYTENTLSQVASGRVTARDADGDILTYSVAELGDSNAGLTSINGKYGNLEIDANTGDYTFTPTVSALPEGSFTEIFHVFVKDANGAQIRQNIVLSFEGDNDSPEFTSAGDISYDHTEDDLPAAITGSAAATDPDGDTLKYSVAKGTEANSDALSVQGAFGTLTMNADTGAYTYTPTESDFDKRTHTDTFTVYVKDVHGEEISKQVTVTVEGFNEAPVFIASGNVSHDMDDSDAPVTGSAAASDGDGDTLTYSVAMGTQANSDVLSAQGLFGTLTVIQETGAYTYTPTSSSLVKGTYTDTFTVYAKDIHGEEISKQVSVNIEGKSDSLTITGETVLALAGTGPSTTQTISYVAVGADGTVGSVNVAGLYEGITPNSKNVSTTVQTIYGEYGNLLIVGQGGISSGLLQYYVPVMQKVEILLSMTSSSVSVGEIFTCTVTDTAGASTTVDLAFTIEKHGMLFESSTPQGHLSQEVDTITYNLTGQEKIIHLYGDSAQDMNGAADTLIVKADEVKAGSEIAGDKQEHTTDTENLKGGDDVIVVQGDVEADASQKTYIAGDLITMKDNTSYTMGNDDIVIDGDVSGGVVIAGDLAVVDGVGVEIYSGNDNIIVTGTMTDSVIYGDAVSNGSNSFTEHQGGDDAIQVGTLGDNSSIIAGAGADVIEVKNTSGEDALIDAGSGADKVYVTIAEGVDNLTIDLGIDDTVDQLYLTMPSGKSDITNVNIILDNNVTTKDEVFITSGSQNVSISIGASFSGSGLFINFEYTVPMP